ADGDELAGVEELAAAAAGDDLVLRRKSSRRVFSALAEDAHEVRELSERWRRDEQDFGRGAARSGQALLHDPDERGTVGGYAGGVESIGRRHVVRTEHEDDEVDRRVRLEQEGKRRAPIAIRQPRAVAPRGPTGQPLFDDAGAARQPVLQ